MSVAVTKANVVRVEHGGGKCFKEGTAGGILNEG